jgi:hypothetical protein
MLARGENSLKRRIKVSIPLAVFICGIVILSFLVGDTDAYTTCQLSLPDTVTMIVDVHEYESCDQLPNFSGYLDATFSNVPSGYSVTNGVYNSFCADLDGYILDNPMFGNPTYQVQLLSSLDNPQFPGRPSINWNKINYILNHYPIPQNSWLDVQAAIWSLIYGSPPGTFPLGCNGIVNQTNVQNILTDANANGSSFIPEYNDLFAIIINPTSCTGASASYMGYCDTPQYPFQILFTTLTCVPSYTVTPSVTGSGTINPSTQQTVDYNQTKQFIVTPNTGYHIASVTGTCGGTLAGDTYTTNAVTADCTVIANFAINTYTVTPSVTGSGTINPSTQQTVDYNQTKQFIVTPNTGYHIASVTGTCGGTLAGDIYTTNAVTADCTVIANFAIEPLTITTSSPLPSGTLGIPYSQTLTATGGLTPYTWSYTGTLPNGLTLCTSDGNPAPACTGKSGGTITGTPTTAGTSNFTATVTDTYLSTATKNFSITIQSSNVRIWREPPPGDPFPIYHDAIQDAYDDLALSNDDSIQCQALVFNENVQCDLDVAVTLKGGYDSNFTSNPGYTTIHGIIVGQPTLTIINGTVTVENIIIQ